MCHALCREQLTPGSATADECRAYLTSCCTVLIMLLASPTPIASHALEFVFSFSDVKQEKTHQNLMAGVAAGAKLRHADMQEKVVLPSADG